MYKDHSVPIGNNFGNLAFIIGRHYNYQSIIYSITWDFLIFFTLYTGKQRTIRRQKYSGNSNIGSGIVWQWMTEKGWVVYDIEAVDAIERAYNQGKPECDLCNL